MFESSIFILTTLLLLLLLVLKVTKTTTIKICFLLIGLIVINEVATLGFDWLYYIFYIFLIILGLIHLPIYSVAESKIDKMFDQIGFDAPAIYLRYKQHIIVLSIIIITVFSILTPLMGNGIIFALDHSWPIFGFSRDTVAVNYIVPLLFNGFVVLFGGIISEKIVLVLFFMIGGISIFNLVNNVFFNEEL